MRFWWIFWLCVATVGYAQQTSLAGKWRGVLTQNTSQPQPTAKNKAAAKEQVIELYLEETSEGINGYSLMTSSVKVESYSLAELSGQFSGRALSWTESKIADQKNLSEKGPWCLKSANLFLHRKDGKVHLKGVWKAVNELSGCSGGTMSLTWDSLATARKELPKMLRKRKATAAVGLISLQVQLLDSATENPVSSHVELRDETSGKLIRTFHVGSNGQFKSDILPTHAYSLRCEAKGYRRQTFDFVVADEDVSKTFILSPLTGMKMVFDQIPFANGSARMMDGYEQVLDQLYVFLVEHPEVNVEISGHTDNSGSRAFNYQLSLRRAIIVLNYLASKGIRRSRLIARGYGPSQPVADNNDEEGRRRNRRVELRVTGWSNTPPPATAKSSMP